MLTKSVVAAILAYTATGVTARPEPELWSRGPRYKGQPSDCGLFDAAPTVKAPKANPWAPMSSKEAKSVWDFVHAPKTGLNLTAPADASVTDNYVYFIDTLREWHPPSYKLSLEGVMTLD